MTKHIFASILMAACCLKLLVVNGQKEVTVDTAHGKITGYEVIEDTTFGTSKFVRFYGIPYAKPPTGLRRWRRPEAMEPWNETLVATTDSPVGTPCIQRKTTSRPYNTSEDCLTLNIYTPDTSGKKAVMFWIHGGGFVRGTSREYEGKHLSSQQDVVVVTVNYRLGIMGFFDSDGDNIWENYGLWDIRMALQWLQNNVASFGGDREAVTIFGGSSGGMTVTLMATSAQFRGLFHRVISESGTHLCPKLLERQPKNVHLKVLTATGCHNSQCLLQMPADSLIEAATEIEKGELTFPVMYTFGAYRDGVLLKADPFEVWRFYRSGESVSDAVREEVMSTFSLYDYIGGFNTQEGSLITSSLKRLAKSKGFTVEDGANADMVSLFLDDYLKSYFPNSYTKQVERFKVIYFDGGGKLNSTPTGEVAQTMMNIYADLLFASPTLQLLDSHSEVAQSATYMYTFTQTTEQARNSEPSWFRGASHSDERAFVFGEYPTFYNMSDYNMSNEEVWLASQMMGAWANFAKTGNPNGNNAGIIWKQYSRSNQYFKQFGAEQVDVSSRLYNMRRTQSIQDSDPVLQSTESTIPYNNGHISLSNIGILLAVQTFAVLAHG